MRRKHKALASPFFAELVDRGVGRSLSYARPTSVSHFERDVHPQHKLQDASRSQGTEQVSMLKLTERGVQRLLSYARPAMFHIFDASCTPSIGY
jgi:hypothetical protein